ncbi:hypothetical protein CRYUN_Cryun06bG0011300 [Craigia yunnanensis]
MAISSKILEEDEMNHLTITDIFITEPFAYVECGKIKVKDEQGLIWMFECKIKSRNKRVFSGHHWNHSLKTIAFELVTGWILTTRNHGALKQTTKLK